YRVGQGVAPGSIFKNPTRRLVIPVKGGNSVRKENQLKSETGATPVLRYRAGLRLIFAHREILASPVIVALVDLPGTPASTTTFPPMLSTRRRSGWLMVSMV